MGNEKALRTEIAEEVWHGTSYPALDAKGEKEVRRELARGEYGEPGTTCYSFVLSWLSSKDAELADKALSLANDANRIASEHLEAACASSASACEQAKWAKWAAVVATTAVIIASKDQIIELISYLLDL